MSKNNWLIPIAGIVAGAALVGGWRVYQKRAVARIPSAEALDDPEIAAAYGRVAAMPQMALMRRLVAHRAVRLCPTGAAADIGCGPGQLVIELARQAPGLHITGVDLAAEMLVQAQENAERAGVGSQAAFRLGDANRLPFADSSLDLVVSTLSLHHWADPVAALNEAARVLAPGGAFLIADLRRDMPPPAYLFIWLVTRCVVPPALRRAGEPLGSRNAAYDPYEAARLVQTSHLTGWRITTGPLWLLIEGRKL